jgi:hypothetical protein
MKQKYVTKIRMDSKLVYKAHSPPVREEEGEEEEKEKERRDRQKSHYASLGSQLYLYLLAS